MADYIQPTPRNQLLGLLADATQGLNNFGSKPFGYDNPPVRGLFGMLGVPALANTLNEMSYGGSLGTGSGMTWKPKDDTADAVLAVAPFAKPTVTAVKSGAKALAPTASQMLENHLARTGLILNAAPSKAENIAAGLYHPIGGGIKLSRPPSQMSATTVDNPAQPLVARLSVSPEQMQGGVAIPLLGDRAAAGKILTHVDGRPLKSPVVLEGGPDYMRAHASTEPGQSGVWASDTGIISRMANLARKNSEDGKDVFGVYTAMSPTGVDFNTMLTDTLLGQLKPRSLDRVLVEQFNNEVWKQSPEFVGLLSPKLSSQLVAPGAGELRKNFVGRMSLEDFRKGGFPDVASARKAITEPELLDVPLGTTGYAIAKIDPAGRMTKSPNMAHKTYNTQLAGDYFGGLDQQVPYDVMFPNFFAQRRAAGASPSSDYRSFSMNNVAQPLDQQWLDGVMQHITGLR